MDNLNLSEAAAKIVFCFATGVFKFTYNLIVVCDLQGCSLLYNHNISNIDNVN